MSMLYIDRTPRIYTVETDHVVAFRCDHNYPLSYVFGKSKSTGGVTVVCDSPELFAQAGYDTSEWNVEGTYQLSTIAKVTYERLGDTQRYNVLSIEKTDVPVLPLVKVLVGYLTLGATQLWTVLPDGMGTCYTEGIGQGARSVHPSIFHFNAKSVLSGAEMKRIEQEARVVLPAGYRYEFQALVVTKW